MELDEEQWLEVCRWRGHPAQLTSHLDAQLSAICPLISDPFTSFFSANLTPHKNGHTYRSYVDSLCDVQCQVEQEP